MQNALTVITPIQPGHREELEKLLITLGEHIDDSTQIDFARLSMIHFARWVIIGGPHDAAGGDDQLVFGTDHDGDDASLLAALHAQAAPLLGEIYRHCLHAPADIASNAQSFQDYLMRHRVGYQGRHIAYQNHTVASVKNALDLREAVETYLDQTLSAGGFPAPTDPVATSRKILGFIRNDSPVRPLPTPPESNPIKNTVVLVALVLLLVGLLSLDFFRWQVFLIVVLGIIAFLAWFKQTLSAHEARDTRAFTPPPPVIDARNLAFGEDHVVQNQMTHIVPIKPGAFRLNMLRLVLWVINLLAAIHYTKGELGGIPTIHFARWMIIDGGKRLLFFSNFDGSWERYLGDFVDQAHNGLTAIWSNTIGFPPTTGLVGAGASNVDVFKAWTRQYQVPTQVWYSAYPTSTVTNIRNALAIRAEIATLEKALDGPTAPTTAEAWLLRW